MSDLRYPQLALPAVLRAIGRKLLGEFLAHFQNDLAARNLTLPPPDTADDDYFHQLTDLLSSETGLPKRLTQALFTIEGMANPEGQERLQAAVAHAGLKFNFDGETSPEGLTVQVWLAAPDILEREHLKHNLARLTSFVGFATAVPKAERVPFVAHDHPNLRKLIAPIGYWFARHHRAVHSTRINFYRRGPSQFWFQIQHGDTCRWTRKLGEHRTEFVQFKLEDQEQILYLPEEDELWISARTKAERKLYRREFGHYLRGRSDYFSQERNYSLEPLRAQGVDALEPNDPDFIRNIILRQIQVRWNGAHHEVTTASADDVFQWATGGAENCPGIPEGGTLISAAFLIRFGTATRYRAVEISLPNVIKVERPGDLRAISHWTAARLSLPQSLVPHDLAKAA